MNCIEIYQASKGQFKGLHEAGPADPDPVEPVATALPLSIIAMLPTPIYTWLYMLLQLF